MKAIETFAAKPNNQKIWLAEVSSSSRFTKPIWRVGDHRIDRDRLTKEQLRAQLDESNSARAKYRSGVPLSKEDLGTAFSLIPNTPKPSGPQSIMMFGGDRLVVTAETRALLENLDPGPLQFWPVEVFNADRSKALWDGADLHVMQVLECRRDTVADESNALSVIGKMPDGADLFFVGSTDGPDPIVVHPPPEGAAEIWIDDRLKGAMFLTDRITKALRAANFSRAWGLRQCRVTHVDS